MQTYETKIKARVSKIIIIMRHHQHNTNSYTTANENCNSQGCLICHHSFKQSTFVSQIRWHNTAKMVRSSKKSIAKNNFQIDFIEAKQIFFIVDLFPIGFKITLANCFWALDKQIVLVSAYVKCRMYYIVCIYLLRIYRKMVDRKGMKKQCWNSEKGIGALSQYNSTFNIYNWTNVFAINSVFVHSPFDVVQCITKFKVVSARCNDLVIFHNNSSNILTSKNTFVLCQVLN